MSEDYKITFRKETLTEFASNILAKFSNYVIKNKISVDDKNKSVVLKMDKLITIMNNITPKYDTLDELSAIEESLKEYETYIKELEKNGK
jgi:hypothetical protein